MAKAKTQDIAAIKTQVICAALDMAARGSWRDVTMRQIAVKAGLDLADIIPLFADKTDILCAYGRQIDARVAESLNGQSMADDTPRDCLFDILMQRFEILNEDRAAVLSILDGVTSDPKQMVISFPWVCRSMGWMLELAGIDAHGWGGALRVAGLSLVYLKVLRDWIYDDSPDMAVTMASLDKALGQIDTIAATLKI